MQPIIPSLPFFAFPSEKVLAEFRPVRGLLFETPVDTPADGRPFWEFRSLKDLIDLYDPRPFIEAIAKEMGYDPALLAAGEGETGVPGHSWTSYGDETQVPMIVRWQAGDAQMLLTFVGTHERGALPDLRLTVLGDQAARPILRRLVVALTPFHLSRPSHCHGEVITDGQSRRLGLPEIAFSRFKALGCVWATADGLINPERAEEMAEIARSCNLSAGRIDAEAPITEDTLQLLLHPGQAQAITCRRDQRLAPELIEYVQRQSVEEVRRMTTEDLGRHFGPSYGLLHPNLQLRVIEGQPAALVAQRLHLAGIIHEIEHCPVSSKVLSLDRPFGTYRLALGPTSIGPAFRHPESDVLQGTEHRTYGREGATGQDLVSLAVMALEFGMKHLEETSPEEAQNPPKHGWALKHLAEQRLNPGSPRFRLMPLAQPTYGIHRGLPVRIDKTVMAWRADDELALAIDFHHSAAGTHLAQMRRCPIPAKKA
jgi:hypothetical protein